MRILFDATDSGFGNNGGSRSVIKSAEVLATFGHEVVLLGLNKYTWHKPMGISFVNIINDKFDVAIACSAKSVKHTLDVDAKKKFYSIRGYEIWNHSPEELLKIYKSIPCIVNSSWLYEMLRSHNIDSHLIYAGLDFDKFYDKNQLRDSFGAIYHEKHKTKNHLFSMALSIKTKRKLRLLNKDIVNPTEKQLNHWYNKLLIWFSPTELEGFHNPPSEAGLAGCTLLCSNHPKNGMNDYTIDQETALIYEFGNMKMACDLLNQLFDDYQLRERLNKNLINLLKTKIGDRITNMRKLEELF